MMWGTGIEEFGHHYDSATRVVAPHGDWTAIGMFIIPLLVFGLLVWLVLRLTGNLPARTVIAPTPTPVAPTAVTAIPADSAVAIVRERFARGEIDRDEYERLITALRS